MPAQFSISALEEQDINVLGDLLLRSKLSLSINRLLWKDWPNETAQREQYTAAISDAFTDSNMLDLKAVDNATGQIVGYICLAKKERKAHPDVTDNGRPRTEDNMAAPATMDASVLAGVGNACQKVARGLNFPQNYGRLPNATRITERSLIVVELVFIVVEQAYRGKGLGTQLLQRAFAEAREAGVPLCVCSEPAARPFFDKFGFVEVLHADMDLSVWAPPYTGFGVFRLTGMVWQPE